MDYCAGKDACEAQRNKAKGARNRPLTLHHGAAGVNRNTMEWKRVLT